MKKFLASASAAFLIVAGSITFGATAANASQPIDVCVPSDAWTEVIDHPAVGEPTVTIDNPNYVPAQEEVSEVVHHEAEYVHHEKVTHTEYHFAKFTQERTKEWSWGGSNWSAWGEWTKYSPETHTSWELSTAAIGSPAYHSSGTRQYGTVQWERQWQAQFDGQTRTIVDSEAWDEKVKDAWDETVITQEASPAIGEPKVTVDNPDYVAAWTETVEHDAVECEVVKEYPPVVTPVQLGVISAPDCDSDGAYSVEGLVAAENDNGYEGDGYHFYVKNTTGDFGGPGVYTWEAYGIGAAGNEPYPLGTSVGGKVDGQGNPKAGGKVTGTFEVLAATGDCPVVVDPPVEPPVEPEVPAEPVDETPVVVDEPETVRVAQARVVSTDDQLATTGGDINPILPIGGGALILAGAALAAVRRFSHN